MDALRRRWPLLLDSIAGVAAVLVAAVLILAVTCAGDRETEVAIGSRPA